MPQLLAACFRQLECEPTKDQPIGAPLCLHARQFIYVLWLDGVVLEGSWVLMSRVRSRVAMVIPLLRIFKTLLMCTHEPPNPKPKPQTQNPSRI